MVYMAKMMSRPQSPVYHKLHHTVLCLSTAFIYQPYQPNLNMYLGIYIMWQNLLWGTIIFNKSLLCANVWLSKSISMSDMISSSCVLFFCYISLLQNIVHGGNCPLKYSKVKCLNIITSWFCIHSPCF